MKRYFRAFLFVVFSLAAAGIFSLDPVPDEGAVREELAVAEELASAEELPRGFRGISLGMSLEETKDALKEDPWFLFRGDPDVSLLASPNESLIDCDGAAFIRRALFQFDQQRLFAITLMIDNRRSDYYSLFTALSRKYGEFESLSPEMVIWDNGSTRLSLERPLTVKYLDREVFDRKRSEARAGRDLLEQSHQDFLDQF